MLSRLILAAAAVVALLPFLALVTGSIEVLQESSPGLVRVGQVLALVALLFGCTMFLYSVRYYTAALVTLVTPVVLSNGNGSANGHGNGGVSAGSRARVPRRGNGNGHTNGKGNGNGNGESWPNGEAPFVSIHIATYNERRVIGRLLEGCAALDYPRFEVIVVDDSTDDSPAILERWERTPRFKIIHRANRDGFKGGALQVALEHTDAAAEFIAVWDADVVPFPDSLQMHLAHFYVANDNGNGHGNSNGRELRPGVAAVQSYQWHVLNKSESWLTEAVRAEYAGSYMVERPFQEAVGALKMIAGTAFMIRAGVLRRFGWGRSLTEDWELTLRLYAAGHKVLYTPYAEAPAECVSTFRRLARQRMRWAEGHSHNVRRHFVSVMRSPRLTWLEKAEFLFYSVYYLQAALLLGGSLCWLVSEIGLHAHIPTWTATFGWSLLLSNALALPVLNLAGLMLEGAAPRDYVGVLGALATSFLLAPFQAFAAVKGFFERDEGPWYRTPKTGRITDPIHHLRRLKWLRRWLGSGSKPASARSASTALVSDTGPRRRRPLGWVAVIGVVLALGAWAAAAVNAPTAQAAGTSFFLHGSLLGPFTLDTTTPPGLAPATLLLAPAGTTQTWAATASTAAAQTIFASTTFVFNYSATGVGGSTGVTLTFAFSSSSACSSPTTIATLSTTLVAGTGLSTGSFSPSSNVSVPAGSFFCFTLTVTSLGAVNLTLDSDAASTPTNISSSQVIFIPERALPFVGLAALAPLIGLKWRRRRSSE